MRFFPIFASASKFLPAAPASAALPRQVPRALRAAALVALCSRLAAAEEPDFIVEPSTVVAGRTLSVLCRSGRRLENASVVWNGRRAAFFRLNRRDWRALVGVNSLEPAGEKVLLVEGAWAGGGPFLADVAFTVVEGAYPVSRVKLAPDRDALYTSGAVDRDGDVLAALTRQAPSLRKRWNGPFVWPSIGVLSSPFGARRAYGDRPAQTPHSGMDIAAPAGTPVTAPQGGLVLFAGWLESFGNAALVDHGQGVYGYFLHMQSIQVRAGQQVKRGRPIGRVGKEGVATGPHVHWTLAVSGERVDPQEWVERNVR